MPENSQGVGLMSDSVKTLKKEIKLELRQELLKELKRELRIESDDEDKTSTPENKVKKWLKDSGFPLEMHVAAVAKDIGFDVAQSEFYEDPETGESREIDLILSRSALGYHEVVSYYLFVECKSGAKGNPWVLFANENYLNRQDVNPNDFANYNKIAEVHSALLLNDCGRKKVSGMYFPESMNNFFPRLCSQPLIGYGLRRAFVDHSDAAYKAVMSAVKSALSLTMKKKEAGFVEEHIFAAPIIVIDIPLFAATYSSDGELNLTSIPYGILHWKQLIGEHSRAGVYIVTKDAIESFFEECYSSSEWWLSLKSKPIV